MMNFLKRLFVNIPDQVLSTMIMYVCFVIIIRGIKSIVANPPQFNEIMMAAGIGAFFGLLVTFRKTV